MGKFLQTILGFSWLFGCFPVSNPLVNWNSFRIYWWNPIVLWSIMIFIFDISLMLDFGLHSVVEYAKTTLGEGLSAVIAESTFIFYIVIGDAALRLTALLSCCKIAKLLKILYELEKTRNFAYRFCPYMYRVYIVIIVANICNFVHESLVISNIVPILQPVPEYVNVTLLPHNDWVIRAAFWAHNIFRTASHGFGISIFLLLGMNLMSIYFSFSDELVQCHGLEAIRCANFKGDRKYEWMGYSGTFLDRYTEKFKMLKEGFHLFSSVAGSLAFSMMFSGGMALVHSVYSLSVTRQPSNIAGTVGSVFWIAFLSFFGNFMESRIVQTRECLQDAMVAPPVVIEKPSVDPMRLRDVTEWVSNWSWTLSAGNLFRINNSLLPAAVGTSMTYVIFVFQLRMSEG